MHDDPAPSPSATAARRFPVRTAAGVCAVAVAVLALVAAWGMKARSEPAARAVETADRGLRGAATATATAEVAPESTDGGDIPPDRELTPFDTGYPAIDRLDKNLLKAVQKAARDARGDGIEFRVTSGWRSREHQQRLLDEGIQKYGSAKKARQFVNTPEKSTHVSGKAVDIGPTDADDWLIRNGADYGLCQVYNNEMWHFELLTSPGGHCPTPRTDAAG
ncbi:M15 family metallopeptidase [Streptomyces sp. NPDC056921]|uniref:M15 family metallopeptidase n=1 Tax=Streptomyces sp. NPDC056921 TaxID=3345966 RepID=UPI00363ADAB5